MPSLLEFLIAVPLAFLIIFLCFGFMGLWLEGKWGFPWDIWKN